MPDEGGRMYHNPEAIEVVRCKDCVKRNTALCPYKYAEMVTTDILADDNEFCSYGKRREVRNED